MVGSVSHGLWVNRYKTSGSLSGWVSGLSVAMSMGLTIWIMCQINLPPLGEAMEGLGRFFM
jgi:hypothetical protein